MSPLGVIGAIGFTLLAAFFALTAVKGRAGTLPRGSVWGLHNHEVKASDHAWVVAHQAAWPILAAASVVCVVHGLGCVVATFAMGTQGAAFTQVLVVSGLIVTIALWFVASAAGVNAVKGLK